MENWGFLGIFEIVFSIKVNHLNYFECAFINGIFEKWFSDRLKQVKKNFLKPSL